MFDFVDILVNKSTTGTCLAIIIGVFRILAPFFTFGSGVHDERADGFGTVLPAMKRAGHRLATKVAERLFVGLFDAVTNGDGTELALVVRRGA